MAEAVSISGTKSYQPTIDTVPVTPFSTIMIGSSDPSAIVTAAFFPTDIANGTYSNLGGATVAVGSTTNTYTLTGTAAQVQAALRAIVFTPTVSQVPVGQTVNTQFALSLTSGSTFVDENTVSVVSAAGPNLPIIGPVTNAHADDTALLMNPGGTVVVTNSEDQQTITVNTPITRTAQQENSVTIEAVLNGRNVLYDQTFALPYSDPAVQAAVTQADADLRAAGATPGAPMLASSTVTDLAPTLSTVRTGSFVSTGNVTSTTNFGPGVIGPGVRVADGPYGDFPILGGQTNINIDTDFQTTIDQTVTTTPGTLLTQDYTIAGSNVVACFAQGTQIATEAGQRAVEDLVVGDRVKTASGDLQAIVWIGHRLIDCRRHARPAAVRPIRIQVHAFGRAQPARDLFVSPDHAVFAEGVLIPVKHLVNGTTVRQVPAQSVTYFHVELEEHDVILAEGLACESYLDTGDRAAFKGGAATELHPKWGSEARDVTLIMDAMGCAPLRVDGPEVEAARAKLHRHAEALAIAG
jgi:hypothetical protein